MRRLRVSLSHAATPLVKYGAPALWSVGGGLAVAGSYLRWPAFDTPGAPAPGLVLIWWWFGTLLAWWYFGGLVRVEQEGYTLVFTGFRRQERVPAETIDEVTMFWWARPGAVTIRFRSPTAFGTHVSFLPPGSPLSAAGLGWLDVEPVNHLRRLASGARAAEARRLDG